MRRLIVVSVLALALAGLALAGAGWTWDDGAGDYVFASAQLGW